MKEEIKKLLQESAEKSLPDNIIDLIIQENEKFLEKELNESAEEYIKKENELQEKFESMSSKFVEWLDGITEELEQEKLESKKNNELNEDSKKFLTILEKYKSMKKEDDESDEDDDSDDDEETEKDDIEDKYDEKLKKMRKRKKEVEPEEDDEEEAEEISEATIELEERIKELETEKNQIIKDALVVEKVKYNTNLSENQKDLIDEEFKSVEFDGDIEAFLTLIDNRLELVISESVENEKKIEDEKLLNEHIVLAKPIRKQFKESRTVEKNENLDIKKLSSQFI